jgi:hypothetical protein
MCLKTNILLYLLHIFVKKIHKKWLSILPTKIAKCNTLVLVVPDFHFRLCRQRHGASGGFFARTPRAPSGTAAPAPRFPRKDEDPKKLRRLKLISVYFSKRNVGPDLSWPPPIYRQKCVSVDKSGPTIDSVWPSAIGIQMILLICIIGPCGVTWCAYWRPVDRPEGSFRRRLCQ